MNQTYEIQVTVHYRLEPFEPLPSSGKKRLLSNGTETDNDYYNNTHKWTYIKFVLVLVQGSQEDIN